MAASLALFRDGAEKLEAAKTDPSASPDSEGWVDRKARERALRANHARHSSGRRRLIDPATCERDYSREELEFLQAMEQYKREKTRPYPTWSEVLLVIHQLGYYKT
jgi:hypothetical protein